MRCGRSSKIKLPAHLLGSSGTRRTASARSTAAGAIWPSAVWTGPARACENPPSTPGSPALSRCAATSRGRTTSSGTGSHRQHGAARRTSPARRHASRLASSSSPQLVQLARLLIRARRVTRQACPGRACRRRASVLDPSDDIGRQVRSLASSCSTWPATISAQRARRVVRQPGAADQRRVPLRLVAARAISASSVASRIAADWLASRLRIAGLSAPAAIASATHSGRPGAAGDRGRRPVDAAAPPARPAGRPPRAAATGAAQAR